MERIMLGAERVENGFRMFAAAPEDNYATREYVAVDAAGVRRVLREQFEAELERVMRALVPASDGA